MKVYIGYDSRQDYPPKYDKVKNPCYEVCKSSILKHNKDIEIQPIILDELIDSGHYYRDVDPLGRTSADCISKKKLVKFDDV